MKRISLAVLFLLLGSPAFADWSTADMNRQIDQTNFLVNSGCSGTLIDAARGYVLTADHCIKDQYEIVEHDRVDPNTGKVTKEQIRVVKPGMVSQQIYAGPNMVQKNEYVYKIAASDAALDLALLQVQTKLPKDRKASKLACEDVIRGNTVYAVGNSFAVLYSTVTKGIVSSMNRNYRDLGIAGSLGDLTDNGEHGLVQHSAVIAGGNSGGALYNDRGELVGVNVRGAMMLGGFSFAVPLVDIKIFLKDNGASDLVDACGTK